MVQSEVSPLHTLSQEFINLIRIGSNLAAELIMATIEMYVIEYAGCDFSWLRWVTF